MAISYQRIKKIEEITTNIIREANLEKLAIDIKKIALFLGVSVVEYDLGEETSGVLVLNDDKGTIGINLKQALERTRFTIAHELGHYILHRKNHNDVFVDRDFIIMYRRGNENYSEAEKIQEQEANVFAASILMPQYLIEKELKNNNYYSHKSEHDLIVKLSKTFKVSVVAMTFRLNNLNVLN